MKTDKDPLISVIIPVYNASKYLEEALDSVAQQTYPSYEVLLIDDGSTDDSLAICEQFANRDDRFKVFNKPNGGVSSARNYGLDRANGQYVTFMDNDDYVYPDWLAYMAREIQGCDVLICNFTQCFRGGQKLRDTSLRESIVCESKEDFRKHLGEIDCYCFGQIWRQLFLKSVIDTYHLRFEDIQNEDTMFSYTFLTYAKRIKKTDFEGYCFIHNEGSLGHHHSYIAEYNWIKRMEDIHLSLIRKYGVHDKKYLRRLNNRFAIHAASYLCKGYYQDTKVSFRVRQQRWSTIAHDCWFRNMKLSDVESNGRKMIMFVCRWHLHWLLDPLLCILLKNH